MHLAIRDQVEAALGALERSTLADLPADSLVAVLMLLGDALRLHVPTPVSLRREADRLPIDRIRAALGALAEETARWSFPSVVTSEEDDPGLAWAIRRRDEVESAILAIRRILIPRGVLEDDLAEVRDLDARLQKIDLTCGGQVTRDRANLALEDRIVLEGADDWMSVFPMGEAVVESDVEDGQLAALGIAGARTVAPSDGVVAEYIRRGALARWVEAAAQASTDFAEVLRGSIETLLATRSGVGLAARRWLGSIVIDKPAAKLAAADGDLEPTQLVTDLGILQPLPVEAHLLVTPDYVTITVSPETEGAIQEVRFGSGVCTAPVEGDWTLTIPMPSAPITLVVTATDGRVFSEELSFALAPS